MILKTCLFPFLFEFFMLEVALGIFLSVYTASAHQWPRLQHT